MKFLLALLLLTSCGTYIPTTNNYVFQKSITLNATRADVELFVTSYLYNNFYKYDILRIENNNVFKIIKISSAYCDCGTGEFTDSYNIYYIFIYPYLNKINLSIEYDNNTYVKTWNGKHVDCKSNGKFESSLILALDKNFNDKK